MNPDEKYMLRALELAENGRGNVSPNPMVGCVVVYEDRIIGEGWHQVYGGPHAEVNAIDAVEDKSLLTSSTIYVNLEPCCHQGKTPPCTDLLLQYQPERVVVCNQDSNPLVAGKGLNILKENGIETQSGVLAEKGFELNKRFFHFFEKKQPYLILKWAETADGFIARSNYNSRWISNVFSRTLVHKWRSEEDAVMVGSNTALYDNPRLNVREWLGRNPLRVLIDRHLKVSKENSLLDQQIPTICYNLHKSEQLENLMFVKIEEEDFLEGVMKDLYLRKIQSVIVEGGGILLQNLLDRGYWQEARVFKSKQTFGEGIAAPQLRGTLKSIENALDDLFLYYVKNPS